MALKSCCTDSLASFPFEKQAWFKNALFRVTLGVGARSLIGPALKRVYANAG